MDPAVAQRLTEERCEFGGARLHDAAHVEGVADLAVDGVRDGGEEPHRICRFVSDQPGAAGAVKADWGSRLSGYRAKLRNGRPRSPRHGQRKPAVGEQRPPRRTFCAVEQHCGADRQPPLREGGRQGMRLDRPRGPERVGANPENRGVAATDHARRIGEDVGSALEHEADHAQRCGNLLDRPAVVLDPLDDPAPPARRVSPGFESGYHVSPHDVGHRQTRCRSPARHGCRRHRRR